MKYINTPELLKMIRANMIKDDIKIKDLATLMDKSQSAASSIMRQENISLDSLKEICDALNYDSFLLPLVLLSYFLLWLFIVITHHVESVNYISPFFFFKILYVRWISALLYTDLASKFKI